MRVDADRRSVWPGMTDARARLAVAVGLVVVVNLILLGAYVWSRDGQSMRVRVEARDNQYLAFIDGKLTARAALAGPREGGIRVQLSDTSTLPSLPEPRGIEWVLVTDLDTGEVLFRDDFDDGPDGWEAVEGPFYAEEGVLGVRGDGELRLADQSWRNYAVDAKFRNIRSATIVVRAPDLDDGVAYGFRPFRHYDNRFSLMEAGVLTETGQDGWPVELGRAGTLRSILAMALRPYPWMLLALAAGLVGATAVQLARLPRLRRPPEEALRWTMWAAVAVIAAGGFGIALYLLSSFNEGMPHVPDEVSYLFQAKVLASGRVSVPVPPVEEAFDYFFPPFIIASDDHWASVYPFGQPLVLAVGEVVGARWLVPPLIGAGTIALTFALGRRLYGAGAGLMAAALLAVSPFFLMTASNFMSHNTTAFFLLLTLALLIVPERRPVLFGALAGVSFGLLFNTRMLEGVAVAPALGAMLGLTLIPKETRPLALRRVAAFAGAALLMLLAYFLYNYGTTGDAFTSGLQVGDNAQKVGFDGPHSRAIGMQNEQAQMAALLLVLNGWPQYIGLGLVLLPFVLGTRNGWDWYLLLLAMLLIGAYVLFIGNGLMHGPRYWYPAAPLLILLAARGIDHAAVVLSNVAAWATQRLNGRAPPVVWPARAAGFAIVAVLIGMSVNGWLLGNHDGWVEDFIPTRATDLKGFNQIDDRLLETVDRVRIEDDALILVQPCYGWQCYGSVFWTQSPALDGRIIYARDLPHRRAELFAAFPDRVVYTIDYETPMLRAFPARPGDSDTLADASPAREIALPTPTATPGPDPAEIARRDEQRRTDLQTIAEALQQYHDRHGTYPIALGLQSLCVYRELDAGCALTEVLEPIPMDPVASQTYLYFANAERFAVVARMDGAADPSTCPPEVLTPLSQQGAPNIICVTGTPDE